MSIFSSPILTESSALSPVVTLHFFTKRRRVEQILLLHERGLLLLKITALWKANIYKVSTDAETTENVQSDVWTKRPLTINSEYSSQSPSHLMAESDGSVGEGLPLFFKCPSLMMELCPAKLKTFPLLQKVGIGQFRGDGRSKAVLQIQTKESNSDTREKALRGSVIGYTCSSCCCNLTSC